MGQATIRYTKRDKEAIMPGMNKYDDKRKRAMRRRNHIARDLADRKYRQRRIEIKRREKYPLRWDRDDDTE